MCVCVLITGYCAVNVIIHVCECALMIGFCETGTLYVVCFNSWILVFENAVQDMMRHQRVE